MLLTKSCWLIQIRAYLLLEVFFEEPYIIIFMLFFVSVVLCLSDVIDWMNLCGYRTNTPKANCLPDLFGSDNNGFVECILAL
jgi:hypothetical protein